MSQNDKVGDGVETKPVEQTELVEQIEPVEPSEPSQSDQAPKVWLSDGAFWATYGVIIVATLLYMAFSAIGMNDILSDITQGNSQQSATVLTTMVVDETAPPELVARLALEFDTLENRQSRAESMLSTRTWLRFMNTAFGAILIMAGAIFILSRIQIGRTTVNADKGDFKFVLSTNSPGIFMIFLGVFMSVSSLYSSQEITIKDGSSYSNMTYFNGTTDGGSGLDQTDSTVRMCMANLFDGNRNSPHCPEEFRTDND